MINYSNLNFEQKRPRQKFRFLSILIILFVVSLFGAQTAYTQCAYNQKYDKIVSGYHASMALSNNGNFVAWGEYIGNDGISHQAPPKAIIPANYPNVTGTVLFAAIGGTSQTWRNQFMVLTTTGLFAWGSVGDVASGYGILDPSLKSTARFGLINTPTGGDPNTKLPLGVSPSQVTMMFATKQTLTIVANGNVWVLSILQNANIYGDGSITFGTTNPTTWHKVKISAGVDLSNVTEIRGQVSTSTINAMMALTSNGDVYTWGASVYLGDNSANVAKNYATKMTLPAEFTSVNIPKMIGVTGGQGGGIVANTFYLLSNSGALYALGDNVAKQCGDFTTNTVNLSWVNVKSSATTNFTNVDFISVQEHNSSTPAASLITKSGVLYTWGYNDNNMLGRPTSNAFYDPGIPSGFSEGIDKAKYAELGGHTLVYVKEGSDKFCYVGHKVNGSMGESTTATGTLSAFDCTNTPSISLCGATAPDPTQSVIAATPTSIAANGTSTSTITIQLKDAAGVNLTATGGNVAVTTTNGTLGSVVDNNNGTYTVILTSSNTITTTTIGFSVNGTTASGVVSTTAVNFIAPPSPSITTTGTLNAFTTCSGSASTAQSFTISGASLTNNLVLTAPTGYEIATSAGGTFSNTINLAPSSGTVSNTSIYVRLTANAFNGASGNITAASVNATTFNIPTSIATVNPTVAASVSISSNATNNTICSSGNIIFTATPTNGGNTPTYQWKLNGTNVGTNTPTYSSSSLSDNDVVSVVMTSSISSCVTGTPASSNTITVKVNALPSTPVAISGLSSICLSSNQVYSIPNVIGATSYDWVVSGNLTATSSTTNVINTTAGAVAGAGTIKVRSVNACGASAYTSDLNITISNIPAPTPNFTLTANNICIGPSINFTNTSTVNATTNSPIVAYNWNFGDGSSAITTQNASNTYSSTGTFNVFMSITSQDNCNVSIAKSIIVNPLSVSGTAVAVNSSVCEGASTTINLTGYTGTIQWMSSPTGANTWTNIIGATNAILNTGVLTSTTDYIAVVRSGLCTVATTSVVTVLVSPTPTITIVNPSNINTTATSFNIAYTINTGSPTAYTMNTVAPNAMPGFVANTNYALSGSPLSIAIPASAIGVYNFNFSVSNFALGCVSAANAFSLTVGNPPPASLSYTTPNVYTVGTGITSLNPSSTGGTIASYSVSPILPAGLTLNTSTGIITGTPTAATAQTSYIVTGTNTAGTVTATIVITVNIPAPASLSYTTPNLFKVGTPITALNPSYTGGTINTYVISPSLPAGLTLNTATGVISGIPSAVSSQTSYTVTGTNVSGTVTATLDITVSVPTITASSTFNTFNGCFGTASNAQTLIVSGILLTNNLVITAPAGYELSTTVSGTYSSSISLSPISGTITNTTIYVRLSNGAFNGDHGDITLSSLNATTKLIATGLAKVNLNIPARVTISSDAINNTICAGTNVTFTASTINGGITPTYQWKLNGVNVGVNSATYTNTSLSNNDVISIIMTSSIASCVTGTPAISNAITINVYSVSATPTALTGINNLCLGSNAVYTINNVIGATSYEWVVTGNVTATTSSSTALNLIAGNIAGVASVKVRSVNSCGVSSFTPLYNITISNIPAPTANFTNSSSEICLGISAINFTSTSLVNTSTNSPITSYTWDFGDGSPTVNTQNASRNYTVDGKYNVVLVIQSQDNCLSSFSKSVIIDPVSIAGTAIALDTVICEGTSTIINLTGYKGTIQWLSSPLGTNNWSIIPGATNASLNTGNLTSSTDYKAEVHSGVCSNATSATVSVTVKHPPSVSILPPTGVGITDTTFNLSYIVNAGNPNAYTVDVYGSSPMPNFIPNINYALRSSPLTIAIPASARGIYTFSFTATELPYACYLPGPPLTFTLGVGQGGTGGGSPASLSYTTPNVYTVGSTIAPLNPTLTGATVTAYSISPGLPAGLIFNTATGIITGLPTAVSTQTSYVVTGTYTSGTVTATIVITVKANIQPPAPPIVQNGKYIFGKPGIPTSLATFINTLPSGIVPVWCVVGTQNCGTTPPAMPSAIGKYMYQLRSYDTTTLLYSTTYVNDTIIIAPPAPTVLDSTYVLGVTTNPANIGVQVSGLSGAIFKYYYNGVLQIGTPVLGNVFGTKKYAVSQTVNNIESDTSLFNVTILNPANIIHLQKIVDSAILQSDLSYNYPFTLVVSNLTNTPITNIVLTDNLQNSVPITSGYSVVKNKATGTLYANSSFNGNSDINVTLATSSIAPNGKDSAMFTVNIVPRGFNGTLMNIAYIKANTKWGTISMQSSVNTKVNESIKAPTNYNVNDLRLSIPEGFSPNNDGVHDYFVIIKPFNTTIELQVFNRWGNIVYSSNNYKNDWNGRGSGNIAGQDLVDGGYYYSIKAVDDKGKVQVFKGFVIIQR